MYVETKLTVRQIADAIRKNGYPQTTGAYYEFDGGTRDTMGNILPSIEKIKGACAMGQAALNLGVDPQRIREAFDRLHNEVVDMNDEQGMSLAEIADRLEEDYQYSLDMEYMI